MEAAAAAMDFHALSRRELQALCKRNGVRANMTNAAMADALQGLQLVDGVDEIGTTLCLPTPGRSGMKSVARTVDAAVEEQQHGSPLPRGRRVSVKSPEAIRMEVEEGEDEVKRDLVKEIVRTPGVALRSTSRRTRATPAPLPTPVPAPSARATTRRAAARKTEEVAPTPATLRRSQRTAARKAAAPVEAEQPAEEASAATRTTRRSARSKVMIALDQEEDEVVAAAPEEKVQQEEPNAIASDVKSDDPEEEEVTKLLEGDNEEEEEGEEVDSSDTAIPSAVISDEGSDDTRVVEEATAPKEEIVEEKIPDSVEESVTLATMEDSPILGVLSKAEASEPINEKAQDASVEDGEISAEWSPVKEMTEMVTEEKEVPVDEAIKEDGCTFTLAAAEEDETSEVKEVTAYDYEMPQGVLSDDDTSEEDELTELKDGAAGEKLQAELSDDDTSEDEEGDLTELKDGAADEMPQAELADYDEEWVSDDDDDDASEEIDSNDESDETSEESDTTDETNGVVQRLQGTVISEDDEDAFTEDDDFSGDLPPEFSDAETESDIALPVVEDKQASMTAVKSLDDSTVSDEHEASSGEEVSQEAKQVDNIVKSLDEFTIKEAGDEELNTESEVNQQQDEDLYAMSLRKLRVMYKNELIASKEGKEAEGKRLPLAEVDDNACVDC